MNYIENIFICLAAPILFVIVCVRGRRPKASMTFVFLGMTACLLSSYISTFAAAAMGVNASIASTDIAPFVEEIMKFLPVLFFIAVFEPSKISALNCIIMVSAGFATLENVCYLIENGASSITHLAVRGFGTGAMHVVCGMIVAWGIYYLWDRAYLRTAGTVGLVASAIAYHGIYNVLVSQQGIPAYIGYLIPLFTVVLVFRVSARIRENEKEAHKIQENA